MIYEIGGKAIEIISIHNHVHRLCQKYISDKCPDFSVMTTQEDIEYEKEDINYPDGYFETLAVYRKIAEKMIEYDTFLFHGSCISVDGMGYLFTAKSGTGKSTHTSLWRKFFKNRAVMVNDDKPLIKLTENDVIVYGTPWNGKHNLGENIAVPLKAICILERSTENSISEISKSEALPMLLQQVYRPYNPQLLIKTVDLINKTRNKVKLYRLKCNMDISAAEIAYNGMKGN